LGLLGRNARLFVDFPLDEVVENQTDVAGFAEPLVDRGDVDALIEAGRPARAFCEAVTSAAGPTRTQSEVVQV
jgi:hypothetical protein